MSDSSKVNVLFVCLGNICRSTMAEGIFQHVATKPPYSDYIGKIDSCGTAGYHVGESPDDRTMSTLKKNGVNTYVHAGRQVRLSDFDTFDYIFAMDNSNLSNLEALKRKKPDSKAQVMLFGKYSGSDKQEIVRDPYYGGQEGFDTAYQQCQRFTKNFLAEITGGK